MANFDIFRNNVNGNGVFSMASLTGAVNRVPYNPQLLGSLNIFEPTPVRTRTVWVERKNNTLSLIPTTAVGSPPTSRQKDKRDATPFQTVRLAEQSTIYAEEIQSVRAFGSETELKTMQGEVMNRLTNLRDDLELTKEFHRLGAIQGLVLDADGTTVIEDYFDAFSIPQAPAVDFELDQEGTQVRDKCDEVYRSMERSAKGAFIPNVTEVYAVCGDAFYDRLRGHPSVEKFYINRGGPVNDLIEKSRSFRSFYFEGITFHNYRGTDDNSTVAIATNECKFFPVKARDMFKVAYAPAEFAQYVNTPGLPMYSMVIPDLKRQAYVDAEVYSHNLHICQRPEVLRTAVAF